MNLLKEYRRVCGITQNELVDELKKVNPGIDVPLLSKMERGLCEPPLNVQVYLKNVLTEKNLESLISNQVTMPSEIKELLKRPVYFEVYKEISKGSFDSPVTKSYLRAQTGLKDRDLRRVVADLRNAGLRVFASSGSVGYWICQSESQYNEMRNELIARAKALFREVAAMDNCNPNQLEMEL